MITKEQAVDIARDLGFDLTMQHMTYWQTGILLDCVNDGFGGYVYIGYLSPAQAMYFDNSTIIASVLRENFGPTWVTGDYVFDVATGQLETRTLRAETKFCVFDRIENPRNVTCSFYGYRFKI